MKVAQRLRRAWFLARVRARLSRRLENADEVFRAFRGGTPVARLALRGGPTIEATPRDDAFGTFWEIFVDRCYLRPGFCRLAPGDTVVDVGANLGMFSLQCASTPGVRVHAVEPAPGTFARLERNVAASGLGAAIAAHRLALGRGAGVLHLVGEGASGHQVLSASADGQGGDPVDCLPIDAFFDREGIDRCALLKIDAEGAEVDILSAPAADFWRRVDRVVLEHHDHLTANAGAEAERLLRRFGFDCYRRPIAGFPELGLIYARRPPTRGGRRAPMTAGARRQPARST